MPACAGPAPLRDLLQAAPIELDKLPQPDGDPGDIRVCRIEDAIAFRSGRVTRGQWPEVPPAPYFLISSSIASPIAWPIRVNQIALPR